MEYYICNLRLQPRKLVAVYCIVYNTYNKIYMRVYNNIKLYCRVVDTVKNGYPRLACNILKFF